jgi:hypothetical protein
LPTKLPSSSWQYRRREADFLLSGMSPAARTLDAHYCALGTMWAAPVGMLYVNRLFILTI